ncbi:MAG: hypothetical protein WBK20_13990 [Spirochaetota bacterium]
MKISLKPICLFFFVVMHLSQPFAQSQHHYTWQQISGNWSVVSDNKESYLRENRGKVYNFGYSPLINCNSIITTDELPEYTMITHTLAINAPSNDAAFMTFFAATDYRQFYGVQFSANESSIYTVSIVQSDIKDTTLPRQAKGNFTVTTLASQELSLNPGQTYTIAIAINSKAISVLIDKTQVLSLKVPHQPHGGKIGFSSKHCIPIIDNLIVYNDNTIIFTDDFSKESIRKIVLHGKKLTPEEVKKKEKLKEHKN